MYITGPFGENTLGMHAVPRIADHFIVVNEEEMSSIFAFRDNKDHSICIEDLFCFLKEDILQGKKISYKTTVQYGTTFSHFAIQQIDDLCDWMNEKRALS